MSPTYFSSRSGPADDGSIDLSERMLTKQEFGKRLYDLMIKHNMNQSDLARASKLGRDSISTYVRGRSIPTPKNLERIAEALGVKAEKLYPNYAANAVGLDQPKLSVTQVHDESDKMWLKVHMKVNPDIAIKVMQILNEQD